MAVDLKVVGKSVPRVDVVAKVTGDARFTVDVKLPGMLYAKFLRSPHPFAVVKSISTKKAEALSGVKAVITHHEMKGTVVRGSPIDDKVRYLGEPVVGIAAESEERATEALALIDVEYEKLPCVRNAEEALRPDAPRIWPEGNLCEWPGKPAGPDKKTVQWTKGDLNHGFAEADVTIASEFSTHTQFHVALEPHACVASWDPAEGQLTFWVSTQHIYWDQQSLAKFLKLPLEKVKVICSYCGGAFGGKLSTLKEYHMTAALSVRSRRPVKFVPTREEESVTTALRTPATFYYKIGGKKDGTLTAIDLYCVRDGGPLTANQPKFTLGCTDYVVSYFTCDHVHYEGKSAYTNQSPTAAFRGFGYFEAGTGLEQAIDMLVEKIGMDPVEFYIKNVPRRGALLGADQGICTTGGIREVIQACADRIGWKEKRHKPGERTLPDGRKHGIAIGFAMGRATMPPIQFAGNTVVKINTDGKVHVFAGVSDMGQGQATGLVQIAAETLGVRFEDVTITWGDTVAPNTAYQGASATTMMSGNATLLACEDARQKLLINAAAMLNVPIETLRIENGEIYVAEEPNRRITVAAAVDRPGWKVIIGEGNWSMPLAKNQPRAPVICFTEVAVDTGTGKIEVIKLLQGTDCGKIIGRERLEGQLQGVLSGGLGFMLLEDWAIDEERMRILNGNMLDYKIFTSLDSSNDAMEPCVIIEDNDPIGPFGARGIGEACLAGAGPAILNAVYNAIGVRFHRTPITVDKVLAALKSGGTR